MIFINSTYNDFIKKEVNKNIIIFGDSSRWNYYKKIFPNIENDVIAHTLYIVDNNLEKQNTFCSIYEKELIIKGVDELYKEKDYIILIAVSLAYQNNICDQLLGMNLSDNIKCYSLPLMIYNRTKIDNSCVDCYFTEHTMMNIPAKIHSFWFSGDEKPDIYKRCIESWHKHCPGYEIIEWNSNNYDVTKNQYMKQAFENKKWAFVSDYARLDVIYQYGGIYLDMDVELFSSLNRFRNATAFFCRQEDGFVELGSGFGAMSGNHLIKEMLGAYANKRLFDNAGKIDMTSQPERLSKIFNTYGIGVCHDSEIVDDMIFLSNDYIVCGIDHIGEENMKTKVGIHWHNAGWLDEKDRNMLIESMTAKNGLLEKYFKDCK